MLRSSLDALTSVGNSAVLRPSNEYSQCLVNAGGINRSMQHHLM